MKGDYAGHLSIIRQFSSLSEAKNRREEIIELRMNKPLFDAVPDRKELESSLLVFKKV
jgi:hypothetical protein